MAPLVCLSALLLCQCTTRPLVATSTQFGANVSGSTSTVVNKATIGYSRSELAYLPNGTGQKSGVVGAFDAEARWFKGNALSETLITGKAAVGNTSADDGLYDQFTGKSNEPEVSENKIVSTNTRSNFGIEAAGSDGAGPSMNFGFRRAVVAIFGSPRAKKDDPDSVKVLPSTYADVSIHAAGLTGSQFTPKGISAGRHLDDGATGSRTVQRIASGRAAALLTDRDETKEFVGKQLRGGE